MVDPHSRGYPRPADLVEARMRLEMARALHESERRYVRRVRIVAVGWAMTALAFGLALAWALGQRG